MTIEKAAVANMRDGSEHHYVDLTMSILKDRTSGLGSRGGRTPTQTVRAVLGEKPGTFERCGGGYYCLRKRRVRVTLLIQGRDWYEKLQPFATKVDKYKVDLPMRIERSAAEKSEQIEITAVVFASDKHLLIWILKICEKKHATDVELMEIDFEEFDFS